MLRSGDYMVRTAGWMAAVILVPAIGFSGDRPVGLPFKSMDGKKVRLADHRGKVIVLNFWATWCVPCRSEMPMLVETEKAYAAKGVVFVAVSLDDRQTRPKIPSFIDEFKIGFPVWTGASTMDLEDLKLGQALPATAFLDRDGRIFARVLGVIPKDELHQRLDWLTGDRKGTAPDPFVRHLAGSQ
jgi:thiol-disulfide isomerase/thioredoxin